MVAGRALLLTDAQREYLREVRAGKTSKEIAMAHGGSHHTVNAEIQRATRLLGARSRHEAAMLLEQVENADAYAGSYEPDRLESASDSAPVGERKDGRNARYTLPLPVPTGERPSNRLSVLQRTLWIVGIASVIALLVGGILGGVAAQLTALDRAMDHVAAD